jgi:PEP-CTERM motif
MKMKRLATFFGLLALAGAVSAHADTIAYTDPAAQGTQAFGGNLALNFNVLSPISVTELGVFNASGSGTITGTIQVAIYNTVTNTEVTPVVTFHGNYTPAGLGYDLFQAITPVVLGIGSYQVDAVGFSGSDLNGNLNTGSSSGPILNNSAGLLAFTGASWDFSSSLNEPFACSSCVSLSTQSSQFDAGTFSYGTVVTTTPEPSTMTLLGIGLIGLAVAFRRKSALARPN